MTHDESWSEQKLDPANVTDRREIITGYGEEVLSGDNPPEITKLQAPPFNYGEIFIEHPENLEGYTPGVPYKPSTAIEGTVSAVGKTRIGGNVAVGVCSTLLLGRTPEDTASIENATIPEYKEINALYGNAKVSGGKHARLFMYDNTSITGDIDAYGVVMHDSACIKGTGAVSHIYLEGDAEINFEEAPYKLSAPNEYGYFYESLMRDNRIRITQPYLQPPDKPRSSFIRRAECDTEPYWSFCNSGRVYWSTYSYDVRILVLEGISQTLSHIYNHPEIFGSARLCFSSTQHKKHIERCRCMLWFPLYLLAEPVALHYFARADGLVGKAEGDIASAGSDNMFSYLTIRDIEAAMLARLEHVARALEIIGEDGGFESPGSFEKAIKIFHTNIQSAVFDNQYALEVCDMLGFGKEDKNDNTEDERNLMYWYLNYLYQVRGITAEEFVVDGVPRQDILDTTALERGIPFS